LAPGGLQSGQQWQRKPVSVGCGLGEALARGAMSPTAIAAMVDARPG
jgi:hypothetical protein